MLAAVFAANADERFDGLTNDQAVDVAESTANSDQTVLKVLAATQFTPTPTPTGTPCPGDCSGNHEVTVDELLTMVSIALGNLPVTDCTAGNLNGDDQITVDEILAAVNSALTGCGEPAELGSVANTLARDQRPRTASDVT